MITHVIFDLIGNNLQNQVMAYLWFGIRMKHLPVWDWYTLSVLGLFLFCFCLVWGEQATDAQDFGWQSKGDDYFRSWFPFFSCFTWWQFCICLDVVWSNDFSAHFFFFWCLIGNFLSFCFLPLFWLRIFSFCFLPILLIGNFLLFSSFPLFFCFCFLLRARFMVSWDFWLKANRKAGHDICQFWPAVWG